MESKQGELDTALAEADGLRSDIHDLQEEKAELISDRDTLQGQVNEDTITIADLRDQIADLNSQITAAQTQITSMEGQIDDLTAQNQELQDALANASSTETKINIETSLIRIGDETGILTIESGTLAYDTLYKIRVHNVFGKSLQCIWTNELPTVSSTSFQSTGQFTVSTGTDYIHTVSQSYSKRRTYLIFMDPKADGYKKIYGIAVWGYKVDYD